MKRTDSKDKRRVDPPDKSLFFNAIGKYANAGRKLERGFTAREIAMILTTMRQRSPTP
jgi:hypothetical protein